MADLDPSRPTSVHPGVDAQSWLGFEQRIQSRRFDALLASTRAALAEGNAVLAQHAIEEAREIRPHSPELAALEADVFRLATPPGQTRLLWRRAAGATSLLAIGVAMFVAQDSIRIIPQTLPVVAPPPLLKFAPTPRSVEIPLPGPISDPVVNAVAEAHGPEDGLDEGPTDEDIAGRAPQPQRAVATRSIVPAELYSRPAVAAALPRHDEPTPSERADLQDAIPAAPREASTSLGASRAVLLSETPIAPPPVTPAPSPAAPVPTLVSARLESAANDQSRVADVLRRYARAYGDLNVSAARDVWPGVDQRALARAFGSLTSQSVSFDDCQIDVRGAVANASCRGQASYVGKVGRGEPRTEPRTWRFELRREGETWKIENAEAKRTSGD
jgi:hypothetical protein